MNYLIFLAFIAAFLQTSQSLKIFPFGVNMAQIQRKEEVKLKLGTHVIQQLKTILRFNGGKILSPEDPEYQEFTTPQSPKCLDRPYLVFAAATLQDTAAVIREINQAGQHFSIISGGHDYECQSTSKYVLVNTKLLKEISIDTKKQTITVQAGVLFKQIYAKLNNTGYLAIGGTCPTVSVSGFTLGGGFNWYLSRFYGIAAENTVAMKVVLATGELISVTKNNQYSDLAWGLLGSGGQQLGLVLEFEMQIYPVDFYTKLDLSYTFTEDGSAGTYPLSDFTEVFTKWVNSVDKIRHNPNIGGVSVLADRDFSQGLGVRRYTLSVFGICRGCEWVREFAYTVWQYPPTAITTVDENLSFQELQAEFALGFGEYPSTSRQDEPCAFIKNPKSNTIEALVNSFIPSTSEKANNWDTGVHIEAIMIKDSVKDKKSTSLGPADVYWKLSHTYHIPHQDDIPHFQQVCGQWNKSIMDAAGDDYLGGYINYFDLSLSKEFYYGENLPKLMALKAKYDPTNRFTRAKGIDED